MSQVHTEIQKFALICPVTNEPCTTPKDCADACITDEMKAAANAMAGPGKALL